LKRRKLVASLRHAAQQYLAAISWLGIRGLRCVGLCQKVAEKEKKNPAGIQAGHYAADFTTMFARSEEQI
jgi:hypothetical protein